MRHCQISAKVAKTKQNKKNTPRAGKEHRDIGSIWNAHPKLGILIMCPSHIVEMHYDFSFPVSFVDFLNARFRNCNKKLAQRQKCEIACIAELSRRSFTRTAMINIKTKLQNQKEAKTTNVQANMHVSLPLQFTPAKLCFFTRSRRAFRQLFSIQHCQQMAASQQTAITLLTSIEDCTCYMGRANE